MGAHSGESVALQDTQTTGYPPAPYHPSENYPEYPFADRAALADEPNAIYAAVRVT